MGEHTAVTIFFFVDGGIRPEELPLEHFIDYSVTTTEPHLVIIRGIISLVTEPTMSIAINCKLLPDRCGRKPVLV